MLLSEVFDHLTYGELAQINIGGSDTQGITPDHYPQVIPHINLALTALHKRFPLRIQEIIVQQYEWIQTYILDERYAETNKASTEPIKYLMDSPLFPFKNNVLKIEQVFSEFGEERPINDESSTFSVFTPTFNSIMIPYNDRANAFSVVYRANHEKIVINAGFDPTAIDLVIPDGLLEPLLFYVVSRVLSGMGGDAYQNESQLFMQRYEMACKEIEHLGLTNMQNARNQKLEIGGWV